MPLKWPPSTSGEPNIYPFYSMAESAHRLHLKTALNKDRTNHARAQAPATEQQREVVDKLQKRADELKAFQAQLLGSTLDKEGQALALQLMQSADAERTAIIEECARIQGNMEMDMKFHTHLLL